MAEEGAREAGGQWGSLPKEEETEQSQGCPGRKGAAERWSPFP